MLTSRRKKKRKEGKGKGRRKKVRLRREKKGKGIFSVLGRKKGKEKGSVRGKKVHASSQIPPHVGGRGGVNEPNFREGGERRD